MAGLSCGALMARYMLVFFNVIFCCCGAVILGVSVWLYVNDDVDKYKEVIQFDRDNPFLDYALVVLIIIGVLVFLVGFLGCCGAWKESPTLLTLYAGLLVLVLIGEIVGASLALYFRSKLDDKLKESMSKQAHEYVRDDMDYGLTKAWSALQYHFECCGGKDYTDYENSRFFNDSNNEVPATCCKLSNDDPKNPTPVDYAACKLEAKNKTPGTQLYKDGCYDSLVTWLEGNVGIIAGVIFGIAMIEIIGIIFACCVKKELGEYKKV